MTDNDLKIKPARPTKRCMKMLDKAIEYYKEKAQYISIVGIWHTSRGTEFDV